MKKRALVSTNPYLKDQKTRNKALVRTVESSSAIEGIRGAILSKGQAPEKLMTGKITVKTSKSLKLRKRLSSS